jgi:hypothetical protein
LPSICPKKVAARSTAAKSSLTAEFCFWPVPASQLGPIGTLIPVVPGHRDRAQITHLMADIPQAGVFAISTFRHVHVP